ELHRMSIERHGGDPNLRDLSLLDAALAVPQSTFGRAFLHHDLPAMAAAYAFHIANNHPFVDGNKRTAALAAVTFLDLNGIDFNVNPDEFADVILQVAAGLLDKQGLTEYFRQHI
ncbi:MAG TPA: type II toxin-antitoxin system death-on-curing family toxin, partial [Tepidisphaeraceae bacterium]|nr:type II toxin-antitoxin system death-on-curing family toxin [Tepidisphaeraceae bacterium]